MLLAWTPVRVRLIFCNQLDSNFMKKLLLIWSLLASWLFAEATHATTLDDVKARGKLLCGVNSGLLGFAAKGDDGAWAGFDVDFCRAVAAAVLGDGAKVEFVSTHNPGPV